MLSPYALTRPGGVQGQVIGLSRSLRALGHEVTVVGPADAGAPVPEACGEHFVIGRPDGAALERLGGAGGALADARRPGPSGSSARAASTWCTCTSRWRRWPPTAWCSRRRSRWSGRTTGPA